MRVGKVRDDNRQPDKEGESILDGAAAGLSSLCLLHCLMLPLGLVLVPALNGAIDGLLHGPVWIHWLLIAIAAPVSIVALRRGVLFHGNGRPWKLALGGFLTMAIGAMLHGYPIMEPAFTIVGGLIVATAHWLNWSARSSR